MDGISSTLPTSQKETWIRWAGDGGGNTSIAGKKNFSPPSAQIWDGPDKNTILSKASIQHNSVDGRGCLLGSYCVGELLLHHVHSLEREHNIVALEYLLC